MNKRYSDYDNRKKKRDSKLRIFTKTMKKKLAGLFLLILVALAILGGFLIKNQADKGKQYEEIVLAHQNYSSRVVPFKRGDIVDRNGNILATSIRVYNVVLDAFIIKSDDGKYVEDTVNALDECLDVVSREEILKLIEDNPNSRYITDPKLKQLSYNQIEKLEAVINDGENYPNVAGIWFEEEYKRMYPYNSLASATIGSTSGNVGLAGLESYYNNVLNGINGRKYGYFNEDNAMEPVVREATDGYGLVSTLDLSLQTIIEKYITQWDEQYHPTLVAVMLADPNTGEILAMADSKSRYDLNNPEDLSAYYTPEEIQALKDADENKPEDEEKEYNKAIYTMWKNFCVSDNFEPGSTAKPFTVAGALEDGKINTNLTFMCDGGEKYSSYIRCHKNSGHGVLNVEQALMNSCNDSLMQIAAIAGKESFCRYQTVFGLGCYTGIDLPNEARCDNLLHPVETMGATDLATNSFGQNFNVTAVQMVAGFSSLINGGDYYRPHVVKQVVNSKGGIVERYGKELIKQTVTKETSDFIRQSMYNTVEGGTGKTAKVAGYKVGGKTGTAQHHDKTDNNYLLSFLGFAPYDDPQVVCYAIVDSPDVPDKGSSSYACKLFSAVMTEVLPQMNIFPTEEVEGGTDVGGNSNTNENTSENTNENTNQNTDNQDSDESVSNGDSQEETTLPYEPSFDENIDPENPIIDEEETDSTDNESIPEE